MFTLKLYKNGPLPPEGLTMVMECAGVYVHHCDHGIKNVIVFPKTVGICDDGTKEFYVGGDAGSPGDPPRKDLNAIDFGVGGNYYGWGVLENANGKTTEMFR